MALGRRSMHAPTERRGYSAKGIPGNKNVRVIRVIRG
jgi:hypothetical protein